MTQLTKRQQKIIEFAVSKGSIKNSDLVNFFITQNEPLSRETAARELSALVVSGVLEKFGKGRSLAYRAVAVHPFLKPMDYESYLAQESDKRSPTLIPFRAEALEKLGGLINQEFEKISLRDTEDIHRLLVEGLNVNFGLREKPVGITGTNYRPLDNKYQIQEALGLGLGKINAADDPWNKALVALIAISYIQPFEDGNKRTARLLANACLFAANVCPLSLRNIGETEYKKAMILFYELQNASLAKKLFLEQYDFSLANYFL